MVGASPTPFPTRASAPRPAGSALAKERRLPSRPCSVVAYFAALPVDDATLYHLKGYRVVVEVPVCKRGKWLDLLSEIAPGLKRVAIMFNPDTAPTSTYMPSLETAARSL